MAATPTRAESIKDLIAAEMVDRGVDVLHTWGKRLDERHGKLPTVSWVESDEVEAIGPPWQTSYPADSTYTTERDAVYDRAVRLEVTVVARDAATTETIVDVLLAAGRRVLTESAWAPRRIRKAGERPATVHARTVDVLVSLPVFDVALELGTITSTDLVGEATDALGDNPEPFTPPP